ncbi:hypothetical protein E2C01_075934 [Portunus trituberculatus]|uniref:Uncharacterized protein n=1 Tax=Portunus trituberculatus TaxID=210409 RepID=A0A5B7IIE0_PORTR|nr:hypothetical protein [Portunus trituberculatus]
MEWSADDNNCTSGIFTYYCVNRCTGTRSARVLTSLKSEVEAEGTFLGKRKRARIKQEEKRARKSKQGDTKRKGGQEEGAGPRDPLPRTRRVEDQLMGHLGKGRLLETTSSTGH